MYHEGEIRAQELAGERQTGESNGAAIGERVMAGAQAFVKAQRMVFRRDSAYFLYPSIYDGHHIRSRPCKKETL